MSEPAPTTTYRIAGPTVPAPVALQDSHHVERNTLAAARRDAERLAGLATHLAVRVEMLSRLVGLPSGKAQRGLHAAIDELEQALADVRFEVWKTYAIDDEEVTCGQSA